MLNPFPSLLTYGLLAPFLLRITIGFILANLGYLKLTKEKESLSLLFGIAGLRKYKEFGTIAVGVIEIVGGLMLIAGFYTQIAALIFVVLVGMEMYIEHADAGLLKRNLVFYVLLFVIALSLMVTGAGFLAFDLPL